MRNILYILLFVLMFFCFFVWKRIEAYQDFGLNLLTELIGIGITVFIIEKIIDHNRLKEKLPVTATAFTDISLLVNKYMSFFRELYRESVNEPEPETIEKFLTLETFTKIIDNTDMSSTPKIFPSVEMTRYIYDNSKILIEISDKILTRHGWHLNPTTYLHIHNFNSQSIIMFWNNYILTLQDFSKINDNPRPSVLRYYSNDITNNELETILYLYNWCIKTSRDLERSFDISFKPDYIVDTQEKDLTYRKDPEKLKLEIEIFNEHKKK